MARVALAPGETGEVQISRQARVDGKWKTVPRGGDRLRARVKYKDHSGTYGEITAFAATKKAAEAKLQRAIGERLAGSTSSPRGSFLSRSVGPGSTRYNVRTLA